MSIAWGICNTNKSLLRPIPLKLLQERFSHIKPDLSDSWRNDHCQLACIVKHNTPESLHEQLPFEDQFNGLVITADCRIDNRIDLRSQLGITNPVVTDSQLILSSYRKWGERCVQYLVGAFVFAIYNVKKNEFFCARDQMGIRPLYYTNNSSFFAFSSEKKGLLCIDEFDKSINDEYVLNLLGNVTQEISHTFYKHIFRLLPAHTLTVKNGNIRIQKYWDLDIQKEIYYKNKQDYVEAFREKIFESVKCRVRSNRPVGTELSGGLDSSGVTAIAQQFLKQESRSIHAFALLMPREQRIKWPSQSDNRAFINEVCNAFDITDYHVITTMTNRSFVENQKLKLKVFDGIEEYNSFGGLGAIKERAQSHDIGVMLSGFPGDQLVTSYAKQAPLEFLCRHDWANFFKVGRTEFKDGRKPIELSLLLKKFAYFYLSKFSPKVASKLFYAFSPKTVSRKQRVIIDNGTFLKEEMSNKYPDILENRYITDRTLPAMSLKESQRRQILQPMVHRRIESENIIANYFGMESRYPLADIRLLEYVLALPVEQKRNSSHSRLIYRKGLSDILPDSIVWRKEEGKGGTLPFALFDALIIRPQLLKYLKEYRRNIIHKSSFIDIDKMIRQFEDSLLIEQGKIPHYFTGANRMGRIYPLLVYMEENELF